MDQSQGWIHCRPYVASSGVIFSQRTTSFSGPEILGPHNDVGKIVWSLSGPETPDLVWSWQQHSQEWDKLWSLFISRLNSFIIHEMGKHNQGFTRCLFLPLYNSPVCCLTPQIKYQWILEKNEVKVSVTCHGGFFHQKSFQIPLKIFTCKCNSYFTVLKRQTCDCSMCRGAHSPHPSALVVPHPKANLLLQFHSVQSQWNHRKLHHEVQSRDPGLDAKVLSFMATPQHSWAGACDFNEKIHKWSILY